MQAIILAFANREVSAKIKRMLEAGGVSVFASCTSRAEVMRYVSDLDEGVVVTGFKLPDATAEGLYEHLPDMFSMLVIATASQQQMIENEDIMVLSLPINHVELCSSVNFLLRPAHQKEKIGRSEQEKDIIQRAKAILMDRYRMTEEGAHRFMQKRSMDTGTKLVDTARMIIG